MKFKIKKQKIISAVLMITAAFLLILSFLPSYNDTRIYDNILRLHVIANSNSQSDQQLKLKVRDAILEYTAELESKPENLSDAKELYSKHNEQLTRVATAVLEENDCHLPVKITVTEEYYPVKSYNEVTLPRGRYPSMRVIIGEGEGDNWWCVLYPPICLSAAEAGDQFTEAGFTSDQIKIITENDSSVKYNVKFKLLESFKGLFDSIFG